MHVTYEDLDPWCCETLRDLVDRGLLPPGTVHRGDIRDTRPGDLGPVYHAFAGIGGWPLALRLAGWPDDVPVWTGSCPCQPFSTAGRKKGTDDARHLWPAFRDLIAKCRPPVIFGEQVASPAGRTWLATVQDDLETLGYCTAAADLCAASIGAPHIRQRLFWGAYRVPDPGGERRPNVGLLRLLPRRPDESGGEVARGCEDGEWSRSTGRVGDAYGESARGHRGPGPGTETTRSASRKTDRSIGDSASAPGPWSDVTWIECTDGKTRPIKSGVLPLAHGVPSGLVKDALRGIGNAIVPELAATFVRAFVEAI